MKVLFAGYGSIARRHVANLRSICKERGVELEIDLLRFTSSDVPEGIRDVFSSPEMVDDCYDAVFVTNSTSAHYPTLLSLLDHSDFFFVEKPVFDDFNVDIAPFLSGDKFFHVASPLRFTNVMRWIRERIPYDNIIALRCISSSYLPDWRPGVDYRQTYSAYADMGGGVEIDLIHELDYVCSLLGLPTSVESFIGKISDLEIDSNDIALYIADFDGKTAEIHVDYFGRAPLRRLEIFTTEETYVCDLIASRIERLRAGDVIEFGEERNDFQRRELEHFLDCMALREQPNNGIEEAVQVLRVAKTGALDRI